MRYQSLKALTMKQVMTIAAASMLAAMGACSTEYAEFYLPLTDPLLASGGAGGGAGGSGGSGGAPPGCIPPNITGAVDDTCGVFVSSSTGDDSNDGTKEAPFATIEKAVGSAKGKPVYLCGEAFGEALTLSAGTLMYGALDCANDWKYVATKRSAIAPANDAIAMKVTSKASIELYDIDITAPDATTPGGSSIALLAEGDTDVMLTRSDVVAGNGAAGADGVAFDMPATSGGDGLPGAEACSGAMLFGGASVKNTCDAEESISGAGGVGQESSGSPGGPGDPFGSDNGGKGENAMGACADGTIGDAGEAGQPGPGASGLGSLSSEGFVGVAGSDGQSGKIAQGGGGGGGAKGGATGNKCNQVSGALGNAGASGGSGGSGGCGGAGGKGGGAGGASLGVLSLGASLTFESVTITTKSGGKGGNGGDGQAGGPGGSGGAGGTVPMSATDLKPGCGGGPGGTGGTGGKGGGGLGGHSIGVAHTGPAPDLGGAKIVTGTAGKGGTGDGVTTDGAAGIAMATQKF